MTPDSRRPRLPRALTIAGSDSGGGAGIQADLKTFTVLGVFGTSALTAVTAQNTLGVQGVHVLPVAFVAQQIDSVLTDIGADAVKTGMLATPELIELVAARVRRYGVGRLVVDPVMVAKGGDPLIQPAAAETLRRVLLPLALVATPNRFEAQRLAGRPIAGEDDLREAARAIHAMGPAWVVVKGGDLTADAADIAFDGAQFHRIPGERVETRDTHGTGCTYSAAITAGLARGLSVLEAVAAAKAFITGAIKAAPGIGGGRGPVNHLYRL